MAEAQKFNKKQQKAFRDLVVSKAIHYLLYGGAAGSGKSWLGCWWLWFMCYTFKGTRWFVGRENMKASRQSVYVTFKKVCDAHNFSDYRLNDDGIIFANGSEIILLDLTYMPFKDPMFERIGSKEFTGGWIEEGGEIHELAFEVLKSRIGRHLNDVYGIPPKMLITCNPKKNWLYNLFYKPKKEGRIGNGTDHPEYEFIQALHTDNPFLTQEYRDNLEAITDQVTRARLLLGLWEYDSDINNLFDYESLTDLFTNEHVKPNGVKSGTSDLAGKGHDHFVAYSCDGNVFTIKIDKAYSTGKEIETDIRAMMVSESIPRSRMVVDADGLGFYLESYLNNIVEFRGGSRPRDPKYANLKTQCYFKLAELVKKRALRVVGASPEQKEKLIEELMAIKQKSIDNDTSKLAINSKEEQKALLGRSPDYADPLMMAMVFRLSKPTAGISVHIGSPA